MSEFDWIARYLRPLATAPGAHGLRDDVARLGACDDGRSIVTLDTIIEGVHFLPDDPVDTVARKLVRANVSDIHAKGAACHEALLSIGWPAGLGESHFARFCAALGEELQTWGMALLGGDTVSSPDRLMLSLTLTGRCLGSEPVPREGAREGDDLWVSGPIGYGVLGLEAARAGRDDGFAARYRVPEPTSRAQAELIAAHASASLDVSDGLIADAGHIAKASGKALSIDIGAVPLARPSANVQDILHQCTGGDDYQALFTASETARAQIENAELGMVRIGKVVAGSGVSCTLKGRELRLTGKLGYSHGS